MSTERKHKPWSELTEDEQFERIARSVASSTALETCESPHEIYRRIMAQRQKEKDS